MNCQESECKRLRDHLKWEKFAKRICLRSVVYHQELKWERSR